MKILYIFVYLLSISDIVFDHCQNRGRRLSNFASQKPQTVKYPTAQSSPPSSTAITASSGWASINALTRATQSSCVSSST